MKYYVRIGRYNDTAKKEAEKSLVKASGGKVFKDQSSNIYAVFDQKTNPPLAGGIIKHALVAIPEGWKEI